MYSLPSIFAESSSSGIGAFNINLKGFIFQLVTFTIVLLIFKRWILPPIVKTLEQRRQTLEESLQQAKETEEALARAETRAEEIIAKARVAADQALAEGRKAAEAVVASAETDASKHAAMIIKEAEERLGQERQSLRDELRGELADLVAGATEKILRQKLNAETDRKLIEQSLKELA